MFELDIRWGVCAEPKGCWNTIPTPATSCSHAVWQAIRKYSLPFHKIIEHLLSSEPSIHLPYSTIKKLYNLYFASSIEELTNQMSLHPTAVSQLPPELEIDSPLTQREGRLKKHLCSQYEEKNLPWIRIFSFSTESGFGQAWQAEICIFFYAKAETRSCFILNYTLFHIKTKQ